MRITKSESKEYTLSFFDESGNKGTVAGTLENIVAWMEKHNFTYVILHKDHLFYNFKYNKTMLK